MKLSEILYMVGTLLIALSVIYFALSTFLVPAPEEDSVTNILGTTTELDSTLSRAEAYDEFQAKERYGKQTFLWIGVIVGTVAILAGMAFKRIKDGPDLFLDDDFDDEEADESNLWK